MCKYSARALPHSNPKTTHIQKADPQQRRLQDAITPVTPAPTMYIQVQCTSTAMLFFSYLISLVQCTSIARLRVLFYCSCLINFTFYAGTMHKHCPILFSHSLIHSHIYIRRTIKNKNIRVDQHSSLSSLLLIIVFSKT